MKLLLVLGSIEMQKRIAAFVQVLGCDVVWYSHVLKAMDNIDEIAPDGMIVSAADFPRHWKTLVGFLRAEKPPSVCPVIVLHGQNFSQKEQDKAKYLSVDCLLPESNVENDCMDCVRTVFRHHLPPDKWLVNAGDQIINEKQLALIITNPLTGVLIPGRIKKITSFGVIFSADNPQQTKSIAVNTEIQGCSLRAGGAILSPVCRLINNKKNLSLEFVSFPEKEKDSLEKFLTSIS